MVSAIGRRLRPRCRSASRRSASRDRLELRSASGSGSLRNGCRLPMLVPEAQQLDRRRWRTASPCSVANSDSSSSGHSMARQRRAQRLHLLALVERFRPHQQVRNVARFEAAHIVAGEVLAPVDEAPEQQADVARREPAPGFSESSASRTFQPLSWTSQSMNAHDGIRQAGVDRRLREPARAVRLRRRQRDDRRLAGRRLSDTDRAAHTRPGRRSRRRSSPARRRR